MGSTLKSVVFFGVFAVLIIVYLLIYGTYFLGLSDLTAATVGFFLGTAPLFIKDVPVLGEYSPAVVAGLLAATAPFNKTRSIFFVAIAVSIFIYILYLHLSSFAASPTALTILEIAGYGPAAQNLAMAMLDGLRTFCLVVAASLVGLRANKQ